MNSKRNRSASKTGRLSEPSVLREGAELAWGRVVTVRDAKAHLSALLEWVAAGNELTIISDGKPKARLVNMASTEPRKLFQGMGDYLMNQRIHEGPSAEEIIRAERDSRP